MVSHSTQLQGLRDRSLYTAASTDGERSLYTATSTDGERSLYTATSTDGERSLYTATSTDGERSLYMATFTYRKTFYTVTDTRRKSHLFTLDIEDLVQR